MMHGLTKEQHQFWNNNRYILLRNSLLPETAKNLCDWTEDLFQWPESPGKWMKYFETSSFKTDNKLLCRLENFIPYHPRYAAFLQDEKKEYDRRARLLGKPEAKVTIIRFQAPSIGCGIGPPCPLR